MMRTYATFAVNHRYLDLIAKDSNFGYELSWKSNYDDEKVLKESEKKGWRFLGQNDSTNNTVLCVSGGHVWNLDGEPPRRNLYGLGFFSGGTFTLFSLSLDVVGDIKKGQAPWLGKNLKDSLLEKNKSVAMPFHSLGNGIAIGPTFPSDKSTVFIDAGGCFWQFGTKEGPPEWARVSRRPLHWSRLTSEVELALTQGVDVDLRQKRIRDALKGLRIPGR